MDTPRVLGGSPRLARVAGSLAGSGVSGTAYWVYLTQLAEDSDGGNCQVALHCTTAGAGTQVADVALASTPYGPKRASQVLTRLASSNSLLTLASAGVKRCTGPMTMNGNAPALTAGMHLWVGFRQAMQTTQAIFWSLAGDKMNGEILISNAAALNGSTLDNFTTVTGSLIAAAVTAQCPDVCFTLD